MMDSLLMDLGFTKSKVDSNLYFKVEGGRPVMLLLYVDDLFLKEKRNSLKLQEGDLGPSDMVEGCVPPMVRCKCRSFLTWW